MDNNETQNSNVKQMKIEQTEQPIVKRIKLLPYEIEALQEVYEEALPSTWTDGLRMNTNSISKLFDSSTIEEVMQDALTDAVDSMELYSYQTDVSNQLADVEFEVSDEQYDAILKHRKEREELVSKEDAKPTREENLQAMVNAAADFINKEGLLN